MMIAVWYIPPRMTSLLLHVQERRNSATNKGCSAALVGSFLIWKPPVIQSCPQTPLTSMNVLTSSEHRSFLPNPVYARPDCRALLPPPHENVIYRPWFCHFDSRSCFLLRYYYEIIIRKKILPWAIYCWDYFT